MLLIDCHLQDCRAAAESEVQPSTRDDQPCFAATIGRLNRDRCGMPGDLLRFYPCACNIQMSSRRSSGLWPTALVNGNYGYHGTVSQ